jgi:hypothetical protein
MVQTQIIGITETEETDVIFTPWSFVHFLSGGAAKELGIPFWQWEIIHALYETKDIFFDHNGDVMNSFANSLGDQLIATVGHLVSKNTKMTWTLSYIATWTLLIALGDRVG